MTTYTLPNSGGIANQTTLNLPDGSLIVGGTGNDIITIANGLAEAGGGNNTIIGTSSLSQATYFSSPSGIVANLQTGIVQNGYGGTDLISGITSLTGSAYNDTIIGSRGNSTFFGSGGSDTYWGNGGIDKVQYYGDQSSQAQITYDTATQSWTIVKNFGGGGTDTLHGIDIVSFDDKTYYSPSYFPVPVPTGLSNGFVSQIVPFTLNGHQDLLVLWSAGSSGAAVPVQVMQINATSGALSDITSSLFSGAIPTTTNPRNVIVTDLNGDGVPDIMIANQGQDSAPFPGTSNTLLLSNGSGGFTDASSTLPSGLGFAHDITSAVVAAGGTIGIFVNNVHSQANNPPLYLIDNGKGVLTNMAGSYLPAALHSTEPAYTSSILTDLNGDGYADLVIGAFDLTAGPSYIYLNPGNGNFSTATPIVLPAPTLAATAGLYDSKLQGPSVLDLQAIHLSSQSYSDLVMVSTNGNYTGYAIQILINDGTGHFTDQTASRLLGAPSSQTYSSGAPWMVRSFVTDLNGDGAPDLVFEGTNGVPSEVFLNDGSGHFNLAYSLAGTAQIMTVTTINGVPTLVEHDQSGTGGVDTIFTVPFTTPPKLASQTATQTWNTGQAVSFALSSGTFTDPSGQGLVYSATLQDGSALPSWLSFDPNTATFSGTAPTQNQSLSLRVTASEVSGFLAEDNFTVTLAPGAAQAVSAFKAGQTGAQSIVDSAANIASNLDGLQGMATAGALAKIALTDAGIPSLTINAAQAQSDATALKAIAGTYSLVEIAPATSATITGYAGALGNTLSLSGTASQYTITTAGDGIHLTLSGNGVSDTVSGVQALKFSDLTDIVAAEPGAGIVTTGNITELYGAVFGRLPDVAGLAFYKNFLAANPNTQLTTFAQYFLASPEYAGNSAHTYAATVAGDQKFITDCYQNLLHRTPSAAEIAFYEDKVIAPALTNLTAGSTAYAAAQVQAHAQVLVYFSASPEFLGDVSVTAQHPSDATHWLVLI